MADSRKLLKLNHNGENTVALIQFNPTLFIAYRTKCYYRHMRKDLYPIRAK